MIASLVPLAFMAVQVRSIPPTPSCKTCRIVLDSIATLGDSTGPGTIASTPYLQVDSRGRFFVSQYLGMASSGIIVFGPNGQYQRTIGRDGSGPGEFRIARHVITPDDTIHVFDPALGRRTIISPALDIVRMVPNVGVSLPVHFLGGARGRWLVYNGSGRGLAFQIINDSGNVERSFGPTNDRSNRRGYAYANAGRFWTSLENAYRLELWDTAGEKHSEIERRVDWFPTPSGSVRGNQQPPAELLQAQTDSAGRLWVTIGVRRPDPDSTARPQREGGSSKRYEYDSYIEVIDPEKATLVASRKLPFTIWFVGPGVVYRFNEDGRAGYPTLDVWKLRLVQ